MNPSEFRVGYGTDVHRLEPGRPLILGSVAIESDVGLVGHSDADVLLHAVIDAVLGAAGLGDIGEWFPNTDPKFAGADSSELLSAALAGVRQDAWEIVNLDCTVHAERPRLTAWKPLIRSKLAALLGLAESAVNVKAKSGERVGFVGRGEAISADAVVLLSRDRLD